MTVTYLDQQFKSPYIEGQEEESQSLFFRTPTNILQQQKAEMTTYPDTNLKDANCCRFRKINFYLILVLVILIYLVILIVKDQ